MSEQTSIYDAFEMTETYEPGQAEATAIPPALDEFLASKGLEAKSISGRADLSAPLYRQRGFMPVLYSHLPENVQMVVRRMYEPPEANNDELRLGDAILVFRPIGAGKYWEEAEKERARAVMGQTSLTDQDAIATEINQRAISALGKPALVLEDTELSRRPASSHVVGGRSPLAQEEFTQEQLAELKARREEIPD